MMNGLTEYSVASVERHYFSIPLDLVAHVSSGNDMSGWHKAIT